MGSKRAQKGSVKSVSSVREKLPTANLKRFFLTEEIFFSHEGCLFLTRRMSFSLTELTDLTEHFNQRFELTERLRHTDITERYS